MKTAFLNVLGFLLFALIVAVAWFTIATTPEQVYVVAEGDTASSIAAALGVSVDDLALANQTAVEGFAPPVGTTIIVPETEQGLVDQAVVHAIGLGATTGGVVLSFWLGLIAGLVPRGYRKRILAISTILGIASYAAAAAVAPVTPRLTPQFVFAAIRDGFAWAAGFPLFARVFGFRGDRMAPPDEGGSLPVEPPDTVAAD